MNRKLGSASVLTLVALFLSSAVTAQVHGSSEAASRRNVRPEAYPANDRGRVADSLNMQHMLLLLKRSPEREAALERFVKEVETEGSRNFHRWLTAEEFGARYGLTSSDLDAVSAWLRSQGFQVNAVYPSGMLIDFSGTAGQIHRAFHTEIHYLAVKNELHMANMSEPRIPAALASMISGVVSLHDFRPRPMHRLSKPRPQFTIGGLFGDTYALVPADLATIYNLNPLFSSGISGQGQSITLIEDTDVYTANDWNTFRSAFGLASYSGASFSSVHPAPSSGTNNCNTPGVFAPNDAEAILDAEWASAAAPSAAIQMAACADTGTTFGGLIALENLINSATPPAIVSISYGQCETANGETANAAYYAAYQQAVAEGISVFVAAGDSGAAGCDNGAAEATHGIGVNAFASTPYNVAVGGTDFSDTFAGTNLNYWNSTNTPTFGSAISYLPEIPWDDSCANSLVSAYLGYSPTYGPTSLCNDPLFGSMFMTTVAGGGGPSQCATGTPSAAGVVSGSCAGWAKPAWQAVLGNPNDGVRDTPDVSLFAADGLWSHYYVFCWSDTAGGGACGSDPSAWSGAGGTSFASPIMAGIQALINQKAGGPQGNPAPVYYQLAAAEYGASGNSSCNSSNGAGVASNCIFYDVTQGDLDVDCVGPNCFLGGGAVGVLSASNDSFAPAYGTSLGWDFATGIGTINAANLVNHWPISTPPPGSFTLSASPNSVSVAKGSNNSATITVTPQNGFSGSVSLSASGLPVGVTASFNPSSTATVSTLTFTASGSAATGTFSITIKGVSGSLTSSTNVSLTVIGAPDFSLSALPKTLSITRGSSGITSITISSINGFSGSVTLTASGMRNGTTASFSPNPATGASTLTLATTRKATIGTSSITVTGKAGSLTHQTTITVSVHR